MSEAVERKNIESNVFSIDSLIPKTTQHELPYPATLGAKFLHILTHVQGKLMLSKIKQRHKELSRNVLAFAIYLETDIFPLLRDERCENLVLETYGSDSEIHLQGTGLDRSFSFTGADKLAEWLSGSCVKKLVLSTTLESNQIVETFLLLLNSEKHLLETVPDSKHYGGWKSSRVAASMLSPEGYHKFCSLMRFDKDDEAYIVEYSYCDLFLTQMVNKFIKRQPHFSDHRVLFGFAPKAAIFTGILLLLPAVVLLYNQYAGMFLMIVLSVTFGTVVGVGINAIASIQYAREHYAEMQKEFVLQITGLAKFPEVNPNPVLKLSKQGNVIYSNPSMKRLFSKLDLKDGEIGKILPADYKSLVQSCVEDDTTNYEVDCTFDDSYFHFRFSPFKDGRFVVASGNDITSLKNVENKLKELNENLEELVHERTHELNETQDVTILCLAGLAETRDPETGKHLQRTREYVRALAEELRSSPRFADYLNDKTIENLYKCTPLHDIGKVGVPDAILLKPGKLTPEEFEQMKMHTVYGGHALRSASERLGFDSFLRLGQDIAYSHHERWDGGGYPKGIKGEEIPWAARLMSLADEYDALVSKRIYKEAFSHEKSRSIIVGGKGSHFDPEVVDAFLKVEDRFVSISEELAYND